MEAVALQLPVLVLAWQHCHRVLSRTARLLSVHTGWPQSPRDFCTTCLAIL